MRVGLSGDYPPFAQRTIDGFVGLDVDLVRRFAHERGLRVELVPFRWPDLLADLAAGRFDLAAGGVTIRPERAVAGRFTRPVAEVGALVLVRAGQARDLRALDRPSVRVAVHAGGHLERVARRLLPHAHLLAVADNGALAGLLRAGDCDALVTDEAEADVLRLPGTARVGPLTRDRKAILGRDPALVDALDDWLRARDADGTLAGLRIRWLGPGRAGASSGLESDLTALLALVDLRLAFMPAVAAAKAIMGRPLVDAVREARVLGAARALAGPAGVDPDSATALIGAQIDAARLAQQRFLALPPGERPAVEALDLERQVRPALDRITEAQIGCAAFLAAEPGALAALGVDAVAGRLDPSLPLPERRAIARAVGGLRPAAAAPRAANHGL